MINFCTLFDSNYLSRGLALYHSLKDNCDDFHLYIFAFDNLTYKILNEANPEFATIISLDQFENEELLRVKSQRSVAEYCWTCTPSTIDYVISNYNVENCTYIDSDLIFYNSPKVLFDELQNGKNVIITEHRYAKTTNLYEKNRAGRFCVQFVTFTNHEDSLNVLRTWRDQCIDWCYARYEDGKFGDQKYLDEWPDKYPNVHILNHLGGGLAPWNVSSYNFGIDKKIYGIDKISKSNFEIIFYHFHFVRFYQNNTVDIGWHIIPRKIKEKIYLPYILNIMEIEKELQLKYSEYKPFKYPVNKSGIKEFSKFLFKKVLRYNIINLQK